MSQRIAVLALAFAGSLPPNYSGVATRRPVQLDGDAHAAGGAFVANRPLNSIFAGGAMKVSLTRVSATSFLLAMFCFLLPFVTLSCPGGEFRFSGVELLTGTTISEPQMFGPPKPHRVDGEPLALAAFLCALAGLILCLSRQRPLQTMAAILGGVGLALLLLLQRKINADALRESQGLVAVRLEAGYWSSLLALIIASASLLVPRPTSMPRPREEHATANPMAEQGRPNGT